MPGYKRNTTLALTLLPPVSLTTPDAAAAAGRCPLAAQDNPGCPAPVRARLWSSARVHVACGACWGRASIQAMRDI